MQHASYCTYTLSPHSHYATCCTYCVTPHPTCYRLYLLYHSTFNMLPTVPILSPHIQHSTYCAYFVTQLCHPTFNILPTLSPHIHQATYCTYFVTPYSTFYPLYLLSHPTFIKLPTVQTLSPHIQHSTYRTYFVNNSIFILALHYPSKVKS